MEPIGETIKRLRGGRRQTELAGSIGMTPSQWNQLESGHRPDPTLSTLERVAAALGVPLSELLAERKR